ncbi:MAG: AsmA family protein [Polaromonas sp.]|nr:AsmA family protein [Polaromonas sp.]
MKNFLFRSTFRRWLAGFTALLVVFMLVVWFFPWDALRGPINRYVSNQLGRRFEITQHLSVNLRLTTIVRAEGVEIANPEWARNPYLLKATAAEFEIKLLPLVFGQVVLPRITLTEPTVGLQVEADGRRTWALSRDTSNKGAVPEIGHVVVDQGNLNYLSRAQGADIDVQLSLAQQTGNELPLHYKATGKWNNEAFAATGRTGGVLEFSKNTQAPFPVEVNAVAGRTSLKAKGSVAHLAEFAGIDATFDLQGQNLDDLYSLLGVVLPSTPPYKLRGKLDKQAKRWAVSQIQGTLGNSDLSGALSFDQSNAIPLLTGKVQSKVMDFADLGPVIGLPSSAGSKANTKAVAVASASARGRSASGGSGPAIRTGAAPGKVLPLTPLDVTRLKAMNADVIYSAADIRHVKELPLDKGSVQVKLNAGVMHLEPISLGVAGGSVAGNIRIDSNVSPAAFTTKLEVRALQLNRLFPTLKTTQTGLGKISGQFALNGRGDSLAQMLGSASGDMAVLMGRGEISNILLEFMGLDGGEVIKFLLSGDRTVQLRCAAAAFDVKKGLMSSRAIVLDTSDTVITGQGQISLANETLDILLKPKPKDMSLLSFRSPLRIGGTFAHLSAGPEKSALAGRVAIGLGLAAINPLLALAATIETGPGENADCGGILALAAKPGTMAKPVSTSPTPAKIDSRPPEERQPEIRN